MNVHMLLLGLLHLMFVSSDYNKYLIQQHEHPIQDRLFSIKKISSIYQFEGGYKDPTNGFCLPLALSSLFRSTKQKLAFMIGIILQQFYYCNYTYFTRWNILSNQHIKLHLKYSQEQLRNYLEDISQLRKVLTRQSQYLRFTHANSILRSSKLQKKVRLTIINLTSKIGNFTYVGQGCDSFLSTQEIDIYNLKNINSLQFEQWKRKYDLEFQKKIKFLNIKSKQRLNDTIQMMKNNSNRILQDHTNKYEELLVKERMRIHKLMKSISTN